MKHLEGWRQIGAHVTDKNGFVVTKCDIIFICVKPHLMYQCAQQIESGIEPIVFDGDKLFLSVMTGVRLDQLELVHLRLSFNQDRFQSFDFLNLDFVFFFHLAFGIGF